MTGEPTVTLELDDMQAALVHPRPTRYAGAVLLGRIDNPRDGRELLRRLIPFIPSGAGSTDPSQVAWAAVGISFQGLKALGVPEESLASFPPEFQQGMAARAAELGDTGESAPEHWEQPLGRPDVHLGIYALAPDHARLESGARRCPRRPAGCAGRRTDLGAGHLHAADRKDLVRVQGRHQQPRHRGQRHPRHQPARGPVQGRRIRPRLPGRERRPAPAPEPAALGRNGSYVVFRKLHTRVAAFRQYVRARAKSRAEEELLAAKFVGRWPSGAPLTLAPDRDDPELGADPKRNNAFLYAANDDARGLKCPLGAHARRTYPRDSKIAGVARMHRIIRRSSSYGPMLPEGVLEDDGADRGILFFCLQARLDRGFEFVKTQWINQGTFIGAPAEMDPLAGPNDETGRFTVPQQPIRRRLTELPQFVVNRGGEYLFMPGRRALALDRRAGSVGRRAT